MSDNKTGFINEAINAIPVLLSMKEEMMKIVNIVPRSLRKMPDSDSTKYIFDGMAVIVLVISIVIINQYSPQNILVPATAEGTIFIVFLVYLLLIVVHSTYLYLKNGDKTSNGGIENLMVNIYSIPLYIIVFVISLVIWFLTNIVGWIIQLFSGITSIVDTTVKTLIEMLRTPENASVVYKYGSLYGIIFAILIILYFAAFDPDVLSGNTFRFFMVMIVPLIIAIFYVIPMIKQSSSGSSMLFMAIMFCIFFAVFYVYGKGNARTNQIMDYLTALIVVVAVIGGLAMIFMTIGNYLKTFTGWLGFMIYFIFYIPCLFIDLVKYVLNEFKMTSSVIFVILVIEVLVILLYFYLPLIMKKASTTKKHVLLPKSTFLDIYQTIGSGNKIMNVLPNYLQKEGERDIFNQNYAFSMWVYLNPQPPNFAGYAHESVIFDYGGGKPKITYFNDISTETNEYGHSGVDKYKVHFTNSDKPKGFYEFTLPSQKWNNIVVNYQSTHVDLFLNGKLEFTYEFRDNPPNYFPVDYVNIGQTNGLDGAICNIVYYPQNLSLIEIATNYNLLMLKNPPY